jgi:putative flippase GtrA
MSAPLAARLAALRADPEMGRLVRFLATGLLNTAFGYGLYALLVIAGLAHQPALILAYGAGIVWNYLTHARLVFGRRGFARLPAYAGAYLLLLALNAAALEALVRAGLAPLAAQALLVLPAAALAFLLISKVLTGRLPFAGPRPGGAPR